MQAAQGTGGGEIFCGKQVNLRREGKGGFFYGNNMCVEVELVGSRVCMIFAWWPFGSLFGGGK